MSHGPGSTSCGILRPSGAPRPSTNRTRTVRSRDGRIPDATSDDRSAGPAPGPAGGPAAMGGVLASLPPKSERHQLFDDDPEEPGHEGREEDRPGRLGAELPRGGLR